MIAYLEIVSTRLCSWLNQVNLYPLTVISLCSRNASLQGECSSYCSIMTSSPNGMPVFRSSIQYERDCDGGKEERNVNACDRMNIPATTQQPLP